MEFEFMVECVLVLHTTAGAKLPRNGGLASPGRQGDGPLETHLMSVTRCVDRGHAIPE